MSEITVAIESNGQGQIIARYDLTEIQEKAYQQGRADEREKMISIVARCIAHNIYNVSEGVNLMNEIKEELEQLKEKSE